MPADTSNNAPMDRDLFLLDHVTQSTVSGLVTKIIEINRDDSKKEQQFVGFKREPIKLHISSGGGSVYDGLALIDTMYESKTPIYTYCTGSAMSMGLPILLMGEKRFAYKYSTLLYHEISKFCWDKLETIKIEVAEGERLQKILDNIIISKSSLLQSTLDDVKTKKLDWFIPAEEALRLNLVDEII